MIFWQLAVFPWKWSQPHFIQERQQVASFYTCLKKNIKKYVYYSAEPLAKSSNPIYSYNKLDKVLDVRNGDYPAKQMSYSQSRQIASVKLHAEGIEAFFVWDKPALTQRNSTSVAGIDGKALFENMLDNSMGVMNGNSFHRDRPRRLRRSERK